MEELKIALDKAVEGLRGILGDAVGEFEKSDEFTLIPLGEKKGMISEETEANLAEFGINVLYKNGNSCFYACFDREKGVLV